MAAIKDPTRWVTPTQHSSSCDIGSDYREPVPGSEIVGKRELRKRVRKNSRGLGRDKADFPATAPFFPRLLRAYYFRFPFLFAQTLLSQSLKRLYYRYQATEGLVFNADVLSGS